MADKTTPAPAPDDEAKVDDGVNDEGEAVAAFNPADVPEVEGEDPAPVEVQQGDEVVTYEGTEATGRRPMEFDDANVDVEADDVTKVEGDVEVDVAGDVNVTRQRRMTGSRPG